MSKKKNKTAKSIILRGSSKGDISCWEARGVCARLSMYILLEEIIRCATRDVRLALSGRGVELDAKGEKKERVN